jgi:phage/plasmid-associated DNA primase
MEYYTTHDKGADTPNQNLYNCRDSRVVSSVEVSDSDYNNNAVKFISSKFKTLSGNDPIYARELGTKKTANFKAGKSFIQTNVMPVFTKLDPSLRERIVVINFPYTFKVNPDSNSPNEKPIDTSLKTEFEKDIYKTAMVALLFEYYKEYKKYDKNGLTIPDSVMKYTKSYFQSECVKGWIEKNFEKSENSSIDVSKLCGLYEQARDKKLSVKKMTDELEAGGYIVKKIKGIYKLKNWKEEKEEDENTNNDEEELIEE